MVKNQLISQHRNLSTVMHEQTGSNPDLHKKIVSVIKTIYDPEIPVDIYELGLIYKVHIHENNDVDITMTLTAPNCPAAGILPNEVETRVASLPDVNAARVEIVFDPPWDKDRMSEVALLELGFL